MHYEYGENDPAPQYFGEPTVCVCTRIARSIWRASSDDENARPNRTANPHFHNSIYDYTIWKLLLNEESNSQQW